MTRAQTQKAAKLRDQAYSHICTQFIDGRLRAGSRLSAGTLAKEFGMSRTPVAEALLKLQIENIVEQVPRVGTIVRKPDMQEVRELYDLRILVESYAAEQAALHLPDRDLALLERLCGEMRSICIELRESGRPTLSDDGVRRHLRADLAFHTLILRSVNNRRMVKAIESARVFSMIFCSRRHQHHKLKIVADIYRWHSRILRAIRRGDPAGAREAMTGHIRESRDGALRYLRDHWEEDGTDPGLEIPSLLPAGFDSLSRHSHARPR